MRTLLTSGLNSILAYRLARQWHRHNSPTFSLNSAHSVLVIELGGLGDAVHTLPIVAALRRPVTVVCRDYVAELFERAGHRAIGIQKSRTGLAHAIAELAGQKWDLIISTCWSTWTTALALQLQATALCGYWRPWRIEIFGWQGTVPAVARNDHLATLRWKTVAPLGISTPAHPPVAGLAADRDARTNGRIVVVPFCGDARKSLPDAEARRLILGLADPILLGGVAETDRLRNYPGPIVTTSIRELLAALAGASCVISVDTGAMHLAAALGVKTVGIFRTTDPVRCGPIGNDVTAVRTVAEALDRAK